MALGGWTPLSAIKKKVATLRTDGKWDEVLATATELAMELDIDAVVQEKRKKVPRRTDDSDWNTESVGLQFGRLCCVVSQWHLSRHGL